MEVEGVKESMTTFYGALNGAKDKTVRTVITTVVTTRGNSTARA